MDKSPDAFRSIGEVSRLVGVAPHVLRYWETQFTQLSPVKRGDGRRYYRPEDLRLVAGLCQVMREEGLSIRGARRLIAKDRGAELRRIGALRLGEILMTDTAADTAPATPTDQPAATVPASAPEMAVAPAKPVQAQETAPPGQPGTSAPSAWLPRLARLAAKLRRAEAADHELPAHAPALRNRLLAAR